MSRFAAILATIAVAAAVSAVPVRAATVEKLGVGPGASCQLSVPTTDTKVRPKALGFRNEGTTNAFTICSLVFPRTFAANASAVYAHFVSFDGAAHTFNCTVASAFSYSATDYLTKSVTVEAGGSEAGLTVLSSEMPSGGFRRYTTMTCLLPPGADIVGTQIQFADDVGT